MERKCGLCSFRLNKYTVHSDQEHLIREVNLEDNLITVTLQLSLFTHTTYYFLMDNFWSKV